MWFVWVKGTRGPEAQLWAELSFGVDSNRRDTVLQYDEIDHLLMNEHPSIDRLKKVFPLKSATCVEQADDEDKGPLIPDISIGPTKKSTEEEEEK